MKIIGISAYYHDAAACLVVDGEVLAAVEEERFTRLKHDACFPRNAILYCLKFARCAHHEIDYFVFYDKPILKFDRLLETYVALAPRGFESFSHSMPSWVKDKLFQKEMIENELGKIFGGAEFGNRLLFSEHHLSHAASAFFPSPFQDAAVLTIDGVGEWVTTSLSIGRDETLQSLREIRFPHSLGLLYSAFTYYLGFKVNSGEYKVMGLAPYGTPKYTHIIKKELIDVKDDGSFSLNLNYFDFCTGVRMTNDRFDALLGGSPRQPESKLLQRHMDLAASVQAVVEEIVLKLGENIAKETNQRNLCLAGGVALNCVANGKLLRSGVFEEIWVQPASGDSGGAIGAALAAYHLALGGARTVTQGIDGMKGAYLGPSYEQCDIEKRLMSVGAVFSTLSEEEMIDATARALASGKAIGWHQGRMEFGPRSLGCRSILADARSSGMHRQLNLKVKYRESFRPFAPSVPIEDVGSWFDIETDSPYMLFVAEVALKRRIPETLEQAGFEGLDRLQIPHSIIPAVTHVDYTARIQTVSKDTNPTFHSLLMAFKRLTGCPVLVNTSFNVRGEPIVLTPEDAFKCFMRTDLDVLVVGNSVMKKEDQCTDLFSSCRLDDYEAD